VAHGRFRRGRLPLRSRSLPPSEKQALGFYLDGRVSLVVGTHTHVPTADERILPQGTAFQTDAGMTGPYESIIGVRIDKVVKRFRLQTPAPFEVAKRDPRLAGTLVDVDEATGKARSIEPLLVRDESAVAVEDQKGFSTRMPA
jgi:calcineurin-like phosphoesterase